ncbi:MAG: hypothetical protein GQ555_02395, partial [Desulfobacterales bacterium]|nr:hypothetical protein [Desulfobacterales bacterium]
MNAKHIILTLLFTLLSSPALGEIPLEYALFNSVDENWVTVQLSRTYASPVVIATPNYDGSFAPLVVRVRNVAGSSFEMRVVDTNNPSQDITGIDVYYFVVEQGVYTEAEHGIKMEAVRYTSTVTDYVGSWIAQEQTYTNSYANPVVLGQVMTENDIDFSVFWSRGADRFEVPDPAVLYTGKHVGEDPDTTRANETIGYVVVEAGAYNINGQYMVAKIGTSSIQGIDDSPPYSYPISGVSNVTAAIVSQTRMRGSNGSWALFYGANPISDIAINLAVDEDQLNDTERAHAGEQVAYMIFGNQSNSPPTAVDDSFSVNADSVDNPLDVLSNDSDPDVGDTLTILATGTLDNGGSVSINATNDGLLYSPATGFTGTETFTYTIEDPSGAFDQATVSVTVSSTNSPPTAVDDGFSVNADSVDNPLDVLSNDSDPDVGDILTIVATGTPDNGGSVSINATNDGLLYSPATGFTGTETFTYTIEDPSG